MKRKVYARIKVGVILELDESERLDSILHKIIYSFDSCDPTLEVLDSEIIGFKAEDSKDYSSISFPAAEFRMSKPKE